MKILKAILVLLLFSFLFVSGFVLGGYFGFQAVVSYAVAYIQDALMQKETI